MVPVPGSSGVPIPCHVTEQIAFLPPLSKASGKNHMMMPNAGDLLEEVYSCAHQVGAEAEQNHPSVLLTLCSSKCFPLSDCFQWS